MSIITVAFLVGVSGCAAAEGDDSESSGLCDGPSASSTIDDSASRAIAFTSDRSGSFDLWLMAADGSDAVQLTSDPDLEGMPSWSPDGTRLAFMSAADLESRGDICVINADGTGLVNLTDTAGVSETTPSWSPAGDEIAYGIWIGDVHQIHVMASDGGESRMVASNGNWPSWSPDGERIVFSKSRGASDQSLWTMKADGTDQSVLADGERELSEPAWSPNGKSIAYVSSTGDSDASDPVKWGEDIFVLAADGGRGRRLTTLPGNDHWPPAWSPDSGQLAFTADGEDNVGEIIVVDMTTHATANLTNSEAHDAFPAWRR
ncbi:MAG: hypothetical protein ABWX56_00200 [Mycetocola sp.]